MIYFPEKENFDFKLRLSSLQVLNISIHANRFTTASLVAKRIDERLEWKHGQHYVPRGNKRLMCFVDDINLCAMDLQGSRQTAVELVRQTIDNGGHYFGGTAPSWRFVSNVQFVATANPDSASAPSLNHRLARHFHVLAVPYPKCVFFKNFNHSLFEM